MASTLFLRTATLSLIAGLAVAAPAIAQDAKPQPQPVKPVDPHAGHDHGDEQIQNVEYKQGAKASFAETRHIFGKIDDSKVVSHTFKFTNTGTETLTIVQAKGSCGCTVPDLRKKDYAPGESGELAVQFNPHNRRGAQHTTVTVSTNDAAQPQTILHIESEVIPQIQVDPTAANLGQIDQGIEGKIVVTITSRVEGLTPTTVLSSNPLVSTRLLEGRKAEVDGESVMQYPLEVVVAPTAPVGRVQAQLTINTNDESSNKRTINLLAMGEVVGEVTASPAQVMVGGVAPGQDIAMDIRLANRRGNAFKVLGVEETPGVGPKIFTVNVVEDPTTVPASYKLMIRGKAPANPGGIRGELVIKTNVESQPEVKIPYYGFVRANARPANPANPWDRQPSMLDPNSR